MIKIQNLTKYYGDRIGIKDVSLEIEEGEIVGLLGPNGAGKTTLIRCIIGYMRPSFGKILINGIDIWKNPKEAKRFIGYLPERLPLYTQMTVSSYLKFVSSIKGSNSKEMDQLMQELELEEVKDRLIGRLSRGFTQRVAMAQALLGKPKVLILDEPTTGLDPNQIVKTRDIIKKFSKNCTILLSTHILSEAEALCDRVAIMNKGEIVALDTKKELSLRLRGTKRIEFGVRNLDMDLIKKIEELNCVISVKTVSEKKILVDAEPKTFCEEKVAKLIIDAGAGLLEMRDLSLSLEEIFVNLTK